MKRPRLRPWIPFVTLCGVLTLLAGGGYALHLLSQLAAVPVLVEEEGPAPLDSYPPKQVEAMRLYTAILHEADGILAAEGAVEERVAQLDALCPRMQALALPLHGMSEYREDDVREALGWPWEKLPTLKATLDHHFSTLGQPTAAGEDRRLTEATLRLMGSDWYGPRPRDITPQETAQNLLAHTEALRAKWQGDKLNMVERLEAMRLATDHLSNLRLPLYSCEDEEGARARAYCREVAAQLAATPGAREQLFAFLDFICPQADAMLRVQSVTEMKMVEEQQSYHHLLKSILLDYLELTAN